MHHNVNNSADFLIPMSMCLWFAKGIISEIALCIACENMYRNIAEFKASVLLALKNDNPGKSVLVY